MAPDQNTLQQWNDLLGPLTFATPEFKALLANVWNPPPHRLRVLRPRSTAQTLRTPEELEELQAIDLFWHLRLSQEQMRTYVLANPYHEWHVRKYIKFIEKYLKTHYTLALS